MSLLHEIQDAATNDTASLTTVLRKCRILATRLKHDGLKDWTQFELDGYRSEKNIPPYRTIRCHSFGNFFGIPGQEMRNAPIPFTSIPKEVRDVLTLLHFRQGVAGLQEMVKQAHKDTLQNRWAADANKMFGASIYPGLILMEAWNVVPVSFIVGILDTVRNRILNFALEVEEQNPRAGDVASPSTPISPSKIQQIFNTTIHGSVGNMATGSSYFSQTATIKVNKGNFKELTNCLKDLGLDDHEIRELQTAIRSDGQPKQNNFGEKVAEWFGKAVSKSAQGLLKVGADVASKVISEAILRYYGLAA